MSLDVCRLCMNQSPKVMLNLKNEKTGDILSKLNACLNYQVTLERDLPSTICKDCYTKILEFYNFQGNCLASETSKRNLAGLPAPSLTRDDLSSTHSPRANPALNPHGIKLFRQSIVNLNDRLASVTQERDVLKSKINQLQKENDILKTSVISHSKNLPEVTKNMMSLLARMEQQFLLSNSKVISGVPEQEESQDGEQMETGYEHMLEWSQTSEQSGNHPQISFVSTGKSGAETVTIPQIAYVCDTMVDHVAEVEINCEPQSNSPDRASPAQYEEERVPIDSEVNALLIQLCEQQERSYTGTPPKSPSKAPGKKAEYDVIVSRRSMRRSMKKCP